MDFFYRWIVKPILFMLDPDDAHTFIIWALEHDFVPPQCSPIPGENALLEWYLRWAIRFLNVLLFLAQIAVVVWLVKWGIGAIAGFLLSHRGH